MTMPSGSFDKETLPSRPADIPDLRPGAGNQGQKTGLKASDKDRQSATPHQAVCMFHWFTSLERRRNYWRGNILKADSASK